MPKDYDYPEWDEPRPRRSNYWKLRKENQTEEKCSECGKVFMTKYHGQKRCQECIAKGHALKGLCACGRRIHYTLKQCSFCIKADQRIKHALVDAEKNGKPKGFKCEKCRMEIPKSEWELFEKLCFECYTKRVRMNGS